MTHAASSDAAGSAAGHTPTEPPASSPAPATGAAQPAPARPAAAAPAKMRLLGKIDRTDGVMVAGWACNVADPSRAVAVDIIMNRRLFATVPADKYRPDLEKAGYRGGNCAFFYLVPPHMLPKLPEAFTVEARVRGHPDPLPPGPMQVRLDLKRNLFYGHVDGVASGRLCGWAFDPRQPNQSLGLKVFVDGTCIGTVRANELRQDLRDLGMGSGAYGFGLPLDPELQWSPSITVQIEEAQTGHPLLSQPMTVNPAALMIEKYNLHDVMATILDEHGMPSQWPLKFFGFP